MRHELLRAAAELLLAGLGVAVVLAFWLLVLPRLLAATACAAQGGC